MAYKYWKTVKDKGSTLSLEDPDGWRSAKVRFSGCVEYCRYHNHPMYDPDLDEDYIDQIHICNIDEEIKRLQELRDIYVEWEDSERNQ